MLLTSIAFFVGALSLARRKVLVQELPAVEGLARVDVVCLDKTGTLTDGAITFAAMECVEGMDEDRAAVAMARPRRRPAPERDPRGTGRSLPAVGGLGADGVGAVLVGPQVERRDLRRPRQLGHGRAGDRPRRRPADPARPRPRRRRSRPRASGCSWSPTPTRRSRARRCPRVSPAVAVLTFEEQVRPDAAETMRYFESQGVALKVISGDNPRTVGGRGRAGRRARRRHAGRRPQPARRPRRAGGRGQRHDGLRPCHPEPEAGLRPRPAAARPRRRHDRRRRQRRAGAQGRRHRRRDGQRCTGHSRRGADRAPRRALLGDAPRGGRRPAGHRQHRAGGQPLPHQERVLGGARRRRGGRRRAVPVPAPPPDPREHADHRPAGLRALAGAEQRALPTRVPPPGPGRVRPRRRHHRDRGLRRVRCSPGPRTSGRTRHGPRAPSSP